MHQSEQEKKETIKMKKIGIISAVMNIGFISILTSCCRGDDMLDSTKRRYDFESWAGTTNAFYTKTVPTIDISSLDLPTNGLDISTWYVDDEEAGAKMLLLSLEGYGNLLDIRMTFPPSVLGAQTTLMTRFSGITLYPLPWVTNGLAGDRCYCKYVNSDSGYVAFARNNVFAEVISRTNTISAFEIAVQLDSAILDASTNVQQRSGMKRDRTLKSRVSSLFRKLFSPNSSKGAK